MKRARIVMATLALVAMVVGVGALYTPAEAGLSGPIISCANVLCIPCPEGSSWATAT